MAVKFDWDENKNRANIAKHGIEFSTAKSVFDDRLFVTRLDPFPDEERFRTNRSSPERNPVCGSHDKRNIGWRRALLDHLSPIRNVSRKESI
jgi:uncharacterized DUF497 family protein